MPFRCALNAYITDSLLPSLSPCSHSSWKWDMVEGPSVVVVQSAVPEVSVCLSGWIHMAHIYFPFAPVILGLYIRAWTALVCVHAQQIPRQTQACQIPFTQWALMTTPCDWLNFSFVCWCLASILFIWDKTNCASGVCACVCGEACLPLYTAGDICQFNSTGKGD